MYGLLVYNLAALGRGCRKSEGYQSFPDDLGSAPTFRKWGFLRLGILVLGLYGDTCSFRVVTLLRILLFGCA